MSVKRKTIVANWKNYITRAQAIEFIDNLNTDSIHKVVVCPPFPLIDLCISNERFLVGAQNFSIKVPHTGGVNIELLKEMGVSHVMIGHVELNVSDEEVVRRAIMVNLNGMVPIIFVGDKESIEQSFTRLINMHYFNEVIVVFEPLFSVGTGILPTNSCLRDAYKKLKGYILRRYPNIKVDILYGGSVTKENAKCILSEYDGVIVGRGSISYKEFNDILNI